MSRLPRITAKEAERLLFKAGFKLARVKGSHHIYVRGKDRATVPHHQGKILHPKIVKQVFAVIGGPN